jgi:hypothetical protein
MPPIIKIGQSIGRNIGHGIVPSHALFHHCMQSHHDHMAAVLLRGGGGRYISDS